MKAIIKNFYRRFLPSRLRQNIISLINISSYEREIENLRKELLYLKVLHHYEHNDIAQYRNEINYLNKLGTLTPFPYKRTDKELININGYYDDIKKMPFVLHKNKKLYFPRHYNVEKAKQTYLNYFIGENILEGGFLEKAPHQYTTESFSVIDGDIVLDIGAAEGLFLLDVIERVKKGYIFESEKIWIEALSATFEPYREKVTIINKFASNKDSNNELTIDSCLKNEPGNIFIKMDVEGSENLVLCGAKNVLSRKNNIRAACCTYHNQNDANLLELFFKNLNYSIEFSDGYMLFYLDKNIKPPYFRKGVIRAKNVYEI
ncbi:MAG: hypothetical protein Q8N05_18540 [Bacteroidota bacterium]|nr:hypothetical protein [Bacteroidota bacterium]